MKVAIISDIKEIERLWRAFSPNETLWDEWDFIKPLYQPDYFTPHGLLLIDDREREIGFWPLWLEKELNRYYTFGGDYMEDTKFWFPLEYFPLMFQKLQATKLFDMNGQVAQAVVSKYPEYQKYFWPAHNRYFLTPAKFNYSTAEYLTSFGKKHRYNLLRDLKKLQTLNYELAWESNEHFDDLIALSVQRFGEESDFIDGYFVEQMRQMVNYLVARGELHTLVVRIGGRLVALELAAEFKNVWYVLNGGQEDGIDNLGKLLIMEHIKEACLRRCQEINFLAGDTGWKRLWNLEREQYYNFATPDYQPVSPEDNENDQLEI